MPLKYISAAFCRPAQIVTDTVIQSASNVQQHPSDSPNAEKIASLHKAFSASASEHFPSYTVGVYPTRTESSITILLVANKYSPQNFWNGRWRSTYSLDPSGGGLRGTIKVDVHYYEDGNVRMSANKKLELNGGGGSAETVVREIAKAENKYQEELNRAFATLAEGSFKSLRRQLPVTRQRVEWERIGGYRVRLSISNDGKKLTIGAVGPGHWRREIQVEICHELKLLLISCVMWTLRLKVLITAMLCISLASLSLYHRRRLVYSGPGISLRFHQITYPRCPDNIKKYQFSIDISSTLPNHPTHNPSQLVLTLTRGSNRTSAP